MRTVKFGIIGGGLMGREFASAAARWCHLLDMDVRPELVAICDRDKARARLVAEKFGIKRTYTDLQAMLETRSEQKAR